MNLTEVFHTQIIPALRDSSSWPSMAAIVVGAQTLEGGLRITVIVMGIIGVLLKGSHQDTGAKNE